MTGKQSVVKRLGKPPEGMSKADAEAILQFLYGAFDKRSSRQVYILHPYVEENAPQATISDFCRWLQTVIA